jgi:hypothetical protein
MSTDSTAPTPRSRTVLWAVLLLLGGLLLGGVVGRMLATSTSASTSSTPGPVVTVTAPAPPGSTTVIPGPPDSLEDLADLPEYSGVVKDSTLADAGDDTGSGSGEGSGAGDGSGSGSGSGGGGTGGDGSGSVDGGRLSNFTMTAALTGVPIMIGDTRNLTITVTNPNTQSITIQSIDVTVRQPAAAGCNPAWLAVTDFAGTPTVVVPARGSRALTVPATLLDLPTVDQNACQGASFPLSLSGTART